MGFFFCFFKAHFLEEKKSSYLFFRFLARSFRVFNSLSKSLVWCLLLYITDWRFSPKLCNTISRITCIESKKKFYSFCVLWDVKCSTRYLLYSECNSVYLIPINRISKISIRSRTFKKSWSLNISYIFRMEILKKRTYEPVRIIICSLKCYFVLN